MRPVVVRVMSDKWILIQHASFRQCCKGRALYNTGFNHPFIHWGVDDHLRLGLLIRRRNRSHKRPLTKAVPSGQSVFSVLPKDTSLCWLQGLEMETLTLYHLKTASLLNSHLKCLIASPEYKRNLDVIVKKKVFLVSELNCNGLFVWSKTEIGLER